MRKVIPFGHEKSSYTKEREGHQKKITPEGDSRGDFSSNYEL
jgi:hypothetical protein